MRLWAKGTGEPFGVQVQFTDAAGEGRNLTPSSARTDFRQWRPLAAKVPGDWPPPLTFKTVTIHNRAGGAEGDTAVGLTRLEVVIDPADKLTDKIEKANKTNDDW